MRLCQCGGTITQHALTRDREAWRCVSCGQYSVIQRLPLMPIDTGNGNGIIDLVNASGADEINPLPRGFCRETGRAASTESHSVRGFLLSGDRPKHDSWLPQVGQNFKNRDTVASNGKVQLLQPVGLAEYTSLGTCESKHVYPLCGVNLLLLVRG